MKKQTISSSAVEVIKFYISRNVKIMDLKVENGWLKATLSSGVSLSVLNK